MPLQMTEQTTFKWNIRVIYDPVLECHSLREVHYKNNHPFSYSSGAITLDFFETVEEIDDYIDKLKRAVNEPVLTFDDFKKITEINEA